MTGTSLKLISLIAVTQLLIACGGGGGGNGGNSAGGGLTNAKSKQLYDTNCQNCHGVNGGGANNVQKTSAYEIRRGINNVAAMGSISLSNTEIDGIARFLSGGATKPLNDTGIITCGDIDFNIGPISYSNMLDCDATGTTIDQSGSDTDGDVVLLGQDALYGRDSISALNKSIDGQAGFSFTKLNSSGSPLADQAQTYGAENWSCVRDNVTGLVWEEKTLSGLQGLANTYTWYNSTGVNDGGEPGYGDTGIGTTTNTTGSLGSDNCDDTSRCDTEKYVSDVNSQNICGANNCRLPTTEELLSIVNNNVTSTPTLEPNYFPVYLTTTTDIFWTSSLNQTSKAQTILFNDGSSSSSNKGSSYKIRLVHD